MTAKEITINYLKSIQRDLDSALKKSKKQSNFLIFQFTTICDAIKVVEESEGE